MIVVKVRDRDIKAAPMGPVTTGSVGLPVRWEFSEEWTGLAKTAVFRGSNTARDVFLTSDECTVPAEVLTAGDGPLEIGVRGVQITHDEDTDEDVLTVVIPTIWGRIERIFDGTVPSQVDPSVQEPDWTDQVKAAAAEALSKATAVEQAAERGDFNGEDGASAYDQAVAGGYTGTEAQFNAELGSFGELSEQAADSAAAAAQSESNAAGSAEAAADSAEEAAEAAPFYAEYGVTTKAEIEAAINGKRQIYAYRNSGLLKPMLPYIGETRYGSTYPGDIGYRFALTEDAVQTIYSLTDQWTSQEINLNAPAQRAEAAQEAAEAAQEAAEAALANIPADYTDLTEDVADLTEDVAELTEDVDNLEQTTTATTIGPVPIATFDASTADMPLKGLTVNIEPVQAGSGNSSPDNVRPITGWTDCKLHHTGVSLIGGDAFIGNTFSKTANGYELSYNGSSVANRASGYADIRGLPAGRYTIAMLNPSYPAGVEVNIRRSTAGSTVTMGVIINADSAAGRRIYDIPENTTSLQLYIIPGTTSLNTSITMSDIVLVREADDDFPEPYNGNVYSITFPSEAGTVYGGTLDALTGLLTVKWFGLCFDTAEKIEAMGSFTDNRLQIRTSDIPYPRIKNNLSQLCSHAKYQSNAGLIHQHTRTEAEFQIYPSDNRVFFAIPGVDSLQGYKDFATEQMNTGTPLTFVSLVDQSKYMTYQLSPIEVATLLGENNIWANRGDVTVTYGAYLEMLKASLDRTNSDLANLRACIAPTEDGDTASQAYAQGAYFFRNGSFCVALLEISSGNQFTLGTNYKVVSVAEAILAMSFVILEQPHDVEASTGVDGTFSVVARGAAGYLWQYWTPNSQTWRDSSITTSDYTLEVTEARYTYRYRCKVTGLDGSIIYSQPVKYVRPS